MKKLILLLLLTTSHTSSVYADVVFDCQLPQSVTDFRELTFLELLDPEAAFKEWKPLAEQGEAEAQYLLGHLYNCGNGVLQNIEQAIYWWTKAAEQGLSKAQYDLKVMHDRDFCGFQLLPTVDF